MCIIYFGTLDNTFSFNFGSSDWHHEVLLLPTERCISGKPVCIHLPGRLCLCMENQFSQQDK